LPEGGNVVSRAMPLAAIHAQEDFGEAPPETEFVSL